MKCLNPLCNYPNTQVVNSRKTQQRGGIWRRRHCPKCNKRYTSIEMLAYFDYPNREKRTLMNFLLGCCGF
jgi:transcriptional regulator NrdR family protein